MRLPVQAALLAARWKGWRRPEFLVALFVLGTQVSAAQVTLQGKVLDEHNVPVASAHIRVNFADAFQAGASSSQTESDLNGAFTVRLPQPGNYLISVQREGYFPLSDSLIPAREGTNEITLVLNPLQEVFESVEVTASPPALDLSQTASSQSLQNTAIVLQPYSNTHELRNALRLLPDVIQDPQGGLHVHGGTEEQTLYTLDGFNVNDPLTGRFDSQLSVEALRSLELSSGRYAAEFGKGSAGVLALRTGTGDDQFRYTATNFVPGIANRKRWLINAWTPRFNLSGPLKKGRAWFSDSLASQYNQGVVAELPKGQDRSPSWRLSNLLRNQINLTPSNILSAGFLFNHGNTERVGLSPLDPPQTTVDRWSRQYFFFLKDQIYFPSGTLLELGYAANRTADRETPQGNGLYRFTPQGRQGNFFAATRQKARRDQWLGNLFLPSFSWFGTHQLKIGFDLDRLHYWQDVHRTGYETYAANGILLRQVTFGGSGLFRQSNFEASSYLQDSWRIRPHWSLEAGIRQDWDRLLGNLVFSPRWGFTWAPPWLERTKISGGYAVVYDATNLQLFTRPLDQYSLSTTFLPDGSVDRGPAVTASILSRSLQTPRYTNWSLGLEQGLPAGFAARFDYLRKRGRDGFTYSHTLGPQTPPSPALVAAYDTSLLDVFYVAGNLRRDVYDSWQVTLRQTFGKQYEWQASYQRSRAFSSAVVDLNIDQPWLLSNNVGRMPWDSPNRFLSWGYLPMPWNHWAAAYLLEWRTGFPFSIQDEGGRLVGEVNSSRFPNFWELNLHLERRFRLRGFWWAFRFGFDNLTNHQNPTGVDNNTGSARFLRFYGGQDRAFTLRIRWLGKQ